MSNPTVPANAGGMPTFRPRCDRREVMTTAWELYRKQTRWSYPKHLRDRRRLFAQCLATAWAWVKERAAKALRTAEEVKAERVAALKQALNELVYLPDGMNYVRRAEALETELRQLEAA